MIEGVTYYCGYVLNDLKLIDLDMRIYENQQLIVKFIKMPNDHKELKKLKLPNDYFLDINYEKIKKFSILRDDLADIRHNLAHINIEKSYGELDKKLSSSLETFKLLIKNEVLYKLDHTDKNKEYTVKYKLEQIQNEIKKFVKDNSTVPKIKNIWDKYKSNELDKVSEIKNMRYFKRFLKNKESEIENLYNMRQEKILMTHQKNK